MCIFHYKSEIHPPELLETLKQTDLYSVGVTESFYAGWKHMAKAEKTYSEIVDMSSVGYRRSDVTTDSSMKLYSSFFDQSTEISPVRCHTYLLWCAILFNICTLKLSMSFFSLNKHIQLAIGYPVIQQSLWGGAPGPARKHLALTKI